MQGFRVVDYTLSRITTGRFLWCEWPHGENEDGGIVFGEVAEELPWVVVHVVRIIDSEDDALVSGKLYTWMKKKLSLKLSFVTNYLDFDIKIPFELIRSLHIMISTCIKLTIWTIFLMSVCRANVCSLLFMWTNLGLVGNWKQNGEVNNVPVKEFININDLVNMVNVEGEVNTYISS